MSSPRRVVAGVELERDSGGRWRGKIGPLEIGFREERISRRLRWVGRFFRATASATDVPQWGAIVGFGNTLETAVRSAIAREADRVARRSPAARRRLEAEQRIDMLFPEALPEDLVRALRRLAARGLVTDAGTLLRREHRAESLARHREPVL